MIYAKPQFSPGGSMASGLLKGMMAGQRAKESDMRMEAFQLRQDRQTDEYEKGQFNERMYNIRQIHKNGGNVGDSLVKLNDWTSKSKNYKDEPKFSIGNWADHNDGESGYTNKAINNYTSDTGKEFIVGKTDSKSPIMFGDKFFDFDTFEAGASNFQSYAKEKDQLNLLNEAKIIKARGELGKTSDLDAYTALKSKPNRTTDEQTKYEVLQKKLKMTEDANIDKLTSDFGNTLTVALDGGDVNQDTQNLALKAQAKAKQKFAKREEHATSVAGSKRMVETYKELSELTKNYDTKDGISKGAQANILKTMSEEDFASLGTKEQEAVLANAIKNTKVFSKVFNVIKEQSGAAFTDEEFARRLATIVGGDPSKINEQTLMAAFGSYTSESLKDTKAGLSEISDLYMGDKLALVDSFNKGTRSFKEPKPETFVKKGPEAGTMSPSEGVSKVASTESKGLVKLAGDVITGFTDAAVGKDDKVKDKNVDKAPSFNIDLRGGDREVAYSKSLDELDAKDSEKAIWDYYHKYKSSLSDKEFAEFKKRFTE